MKRRLSKDSAVSNESNNNFHPQPVDRSSTTGNSSPLWQDRYSIFLLLVLYLLQGVPMGLCGSIPLILKEKGVSYESLSLFSLVTIPFSMKILWAPFVDSYYIAKFGRRKSWLIPVQIVCGIMMILGSSSVKVWMREEDERANPHELSIGSLTGYFFTLYFLMATQDIAVDGWALTMLSRENVGYASTCNTIGQALGFFLANQAFIALSDQRWCHRFLGASSSLVSLSTFMTFWGIVFIAVTVVVWLFKKESLIEEKCDGIIETCQQIVSIGKLSPIRTLAWILLTCKIAFAPSDAVLSFKLQERGMPKSDLATISPLLLIVGLVLPLLTSNMVNEHPMKTFLWGIKAKMVSSFLLWIISGFTSSAYANPDNVSITYLTTLTITMVANECFGTMIFVSAMTFFSKISDPAIGGSYMTLLNTIANWGSKWPNVTMLWLLPKLTLNVCDQPTNPILNALLSCSETSNPYIVDGYSILVILCTMVGALWLATQQKQITDLENIEHAKWIVTNAIK